MVREGNDPESVNINGRLNLGAGQLEASTTLWLPGVPGLNARADIGQGRQLPGGCSAEAKLERRRGATTNPHLEPSWTPWAVLSPRQQGLLGRDGLLTVRSPLCGTNSLGLLIG